MTEYRYSIPTTIEPPASSGNNPGGFSSGDRFVIQTDILSKRQTKPGTFRLNGSLILQAKVGDNWEPVDQSIHHVKLDPYGGSSGVIYSVQTSIDDVQYESILEYARLTSVLNQTRYSGYDMASSDGCMELMRYPTDGFQDVDVGDAQGLLFPSLDSTGKPQFEMPISIDLDVCVNKVAVPSSKHSQIQFSFRLADANKIGLTSSVATQFRYFLKNVELRYQLEPEQPTQGPVMMPVHNHSFLASIINRVNSITHSPAQAFHTMFMTFIKNSHINAGQNNFTYSYLANEALTEKPRLVEFKVKGASDVNKYPLRFIESEILHQFLLAAKEGIWTHNHDVSLAGLEQTVKQGFGLGTIMSQMFPPNTQVSVNIELDSVPTETYSCFVYTVGEIPL